MASELTPEEREFEAIARAGSDADLADAMVAFALNHQNWRWAYKNFVTIARTRDTALRGLAYTCIGHLGRLHDDFCTAEAEAFLRESLARDPANIGSIEDAGSDIAIFRR